MNASMIWEIRITCEKIEMGPVILTSGWDVLSKLAAVKSYVIPIGWNAEAYPVIR